MPHTRTTRVILGAALVLALGASPALAHGWLFTPPPAPAAPVFTGAEGGANAPTPGPLGGGDAPGTGGTTGPVGGAGGGTTPTTQPTPPVVLRGGGNATPAGRGGQTRGTTSRLRPKAGLSPWLSRLHTPWTTVFPVTRDGYDQNLMAGMELTSAEGGWTRRDAPSIVLVYDAANDAHEKLIDRLDADRRFVAAAHLFNCFRVAGKKGCAAKLTVFDAEGKQVGQLEGRRAHRAFRLMEKAYDAKKGADLSKVVPTVASVLEGAAYCDHHLEWMEKKIICPDCGHEREDVVETIDQMKVRKAGFSRALADLQSK